MKPFGMNVIRVGVSVFLFWFFFLFNTQQKGIEKKDWPRFILCALTGIAINQLLFLKGLSLTYSIHAALLMLTTPILITVMELPGLSLCAWLFCNNLTAPLTLNQLPTIPMEIITAGWALLEMQAVGVAQ